VSKEEEVSDGNGVFGDWSTLSSTDLPTPLSWYVDKGGLSDWSIAENMNGFVQLASELLKHLNEVHRLIQLVNDLLLVSQPHQIGRITVVWRRSRNSVRPVPVMWVDGVKGGKAGRVYKELPIKDLARRATESDEFGVCRLGTRRWLVMLQYLLERRLRISESIRVFNSFSSGLLDNGGARYENCKMEVRKSHDVTKTVHGHVRRELGLLGRGEIKQENDPDDS